MKLRCKIKKLMGYLNPKTGKLDPIYPAILCPFHKEKTPSCITYTDGTFHCCGCGKRGNVSEFPEVGVNDAT